MQAGVEDFNTELKLLRRLQAAENIVRFFGSYFDPSGGPNGRPLMMLVMELCKGNVSQVLAYDLFQKHGPARGVHKRAHDVRYTCANSKASFSTRVDWAHGLASGLTFMHEELSVVHKDLKCDNLLVDKVS
eukprot:SAG22_NODE_212_length_15072_cov_3.109197_12_plen_131_part_00